MRCFAFLLYLVCDAGVPNLRISQRAQQQDHDHGQKSSQGRKGSTAPGGLVEPAAKRALLNGTMIGMPQSILQARAKTLPGWLVALWVVTFAIFLATAIPAFGIAMLAQLIWNMAQLKQGKSISKLEKKMKVSGQLKLKSDRTYENVRFMGEELDTMITDALADINEFRKREKKSHRTQFHENTAKLIVDDESHMTQVVGGSESKYHGAYEQFIETRAAYYKQKRHWKGIGKRLAVTNIKLHVSMNVYITELLKMLSYDDVSRQRAAREQLELELVKEQRFKRQTQIQADLRTDQLDEQADETYAFSGEVIDDQKNTRKSYSIVGKNVANVQSSLTTFQTFTSNMISAVQAEVQKPTQQDILIAQADILEAYYKNEAKLVLNELTPEQKRFQARTWQLGFDFDAEDTLLKTKLANKWAGIVTDLEGKSKDLKTSLGALEGSVEAQEQAQANVIDSKNAEINRIPKELVKLSRYLSKKVSDTSDNFNEQVASVESGLNEDGADMDETMSQTTMDMKKGNQVFRLIGGNDVQSKLNDWLEKNIDKLVENVEADGKEDTETDKDVDKTRPRDARDLDRKRKGLSQQIEDWSESKQLLDLDLIKIPKLADFAAEKKMNGTNALHDVTHEALETYNQALKTRADDMVETKHKLDHDWYDKFQTMSEKLAKSMVDVDGVVKKEDSEMEKIDAKDFSRLQMLNLQRKGVADAETNTNLAGRDLLRSTQKLMDNQQETQDKLKNKLTVAYPLSKESAEKGITEAGLVYQHGFEQLQDRFLAGVNTVARSIPQLQSKVVSGAAKVSRQVTKQKKNLEISENTIQGASAFAAEGISDTAKTFSDWAHRISSDGETLQHSAADRVDRAVDLFNGNVGAADLPGMAEEKAKIELQKLSSQISQVTGLGSLQIRAGPLQDTVYAAQKLVAKLHRSGEKMSADMHDTVRRLQDVIRASVHLDDVTKTALLADLDFSVEGAGFHMAEGGASAISAAEQQVAGDINLAEHRLRAQSSNEEFDASAVQHDVDNEANSILSKASGFEQQVEGAQTQEQRRKAKQDKQAADLATRMLAQAQELQLRHLEEQDTCIGAYKDMGSDLENLERFVDRLNGKVEVARKTAEKQGYSDVHGVADATERAGDGLTKQVGSVTVLLNGDAHELDETKQQLSDANRAMAAHLKEANPQQSIDQANQYMWMLEDQLSDDEKAALNASSTKIGDMVDKLTSTFDSFPPIEKTVQAQHDLKVELQNHGQFLINAVKGGGQKVMSVLDELLFDQDQGSMDARRKVSEAEDKLDRDIPRLRDLPAGAAPGLGEIEGLLVGGTRAAKAKALQTIEEAQSFDKNLKAEMGRSKVAHDNALVDAVRAGQAAAMAQVSDARDASEKKMEEQKAAGLSAAQIYLGMDSQSQLVDESLVKISMALEKLQPTGLENDPSFKKASLDLDQLEDILKRMPRTPSLLEAEARALQRSERSDAEGDARLQQGLEALKGLKNELSV